MARSEQEILLDQMRLGGAQDLAAQQVAHQKLDVEPGILESAGNSIAAGARSFLGGATAGFADPAIAGIQTGLEAGANALGILPEGYQQGGYSENLAQTRQVRRDLEKQNPLSSFVGGVAGQIASPVTKAVPGVAGMTLQSGVQGLNESGDVRTGVENAAMAFGTGLILKGAGAAGKKLFSERSANLAAAKALGVTESHLPKGANMDSVGKWLRESGIVTAKDTVASATKKVQVEAAKIAGRLEQHFLDLDSKLLQGHAPDAREVGAKVWDRHIVAAIKNHPEMGQEIERAAATLHNRFVRAGSSVRPPVPGSAPQGAPGAIPTTTLHGVYKFQQGLQRLLSESKSEAEKIAIRSYNRGLEQSLERASDIARQQGISTGIDFRLLTERSRLLSNLVETGSHKAAQRASRDIFSPARALSASLGFKFGPVGAVLGAAAGPAIQDAAAARAYPILSATLGKGAEVSVPAGVKEGVKGGILEALRGTNQ